MSASSIPHGLATLIVAFACSAALAATAPGLRQVPPAVRAGLALTLVPALAVRAPVAANLALPQLLAGGLEAALLGAGVGLCASVVAAAAGAAGALVDAAIASQPFGPERVVGVDSGPIGRLYTLAFAWMFYGGPFVALLERLASAAQSFHAQPLASGAIAVLAGALFAAALALAGPALCAQVLATLMAGLFARVSAIPNGLFIGPPLGLGLALLALLAGAQSAFGAIGALCERAGAAASVWIR